MNPTLNMDNDEKVPTRNGYGEGVKEAGEEDKNVVVLCCDLTDSTRSSYFKEAFPDRFVEVGVAEQNMAGIAAGMSLAGKIPFLSSYAVFNPGINWSQIRVSICYSEANVKIMGAHAGVSVGPDGATHQALEDIAITRVLPNMTVVVPCDYTETKKATKALAKMKGPAYMRFARAGTPVFTTEETPFRIGKAEVFREGRDVTIVACGPVVHEALKAAQELESEGISARVINNHTVKPLDQDTLIAAARETGAIVTAEEHQVHGGMGSAVAELLSRHNPVPMEYIGMSDRFGESGTPDELFEEFGFTSPAIKDAVKRVMERKQDEPNENGFRHPFHLVNGKKIRTEKELLLYLQETSDAEYWYHVTNQRNDFANWVRKVLKNDVLADRLEGADIRDEAIRILKEDLM